MHCGILKQYRFEEEREQKVASQRISRHTPRNKEAPIPTAATLPLHLTRNHRLVATD